jgi:hypothetical protein
VAIAVLALMGAGVVAKMRSQPVTSDSALGDARHRWGVVGAVGQGGVGDVMMVTNDGDLGEQSRLFEVAIGADLSGRVRLRHELGLDVVWEWKWPDVPLSRGIEVDPSHAGFGRVSGSNEGRSLGYHFCEVGWPFTEAGRQGGECGNVVLQAFVELDPVSFGLSQGELQGAEESSRASRDGYGHKPELAQVTFPGLAADALPSL